MNIITKHRKRGIGTLVVLLILLCFIFTPSLLFGDYDFSLDHKKIDDEEYLNLSTNYLFKGTTYDFNLDDFYDDTNLYKIYTGAKFQTEMFNGTTLEWSGVVNNDTVTPVNNTETQYGTSSGHYNATHSFTEEEDGTSGDNIDFVHSITGSGTIEIQAEKKLHKKVLYIKSTNAAYTSVWHIFEQDQNFGTVELWQYPVKDDIDWSCRVMFYDSSGKSAYILVNSAGQYKWYDGSSSTTLATGVSNHWNHLKFTWDGNNIDVYVNGSKTSVLLGAGQTSVNSIRLYQFDDEGEMWFDAIGFKTGDYLATESFDYTTEEGVYYGTHDFRDEIGETDLDISWIDSMSADDTGNVAEVIVTEDGHKNIIKFITDGNNGKYAYWKNDPANQVSGTIELWTKYIDHGQGSMSFYFEGSILFLTSFNLNDNKLYSHYGDGLGGHIYSSTSAPADTWHHLKWTWDCITDTYSLWFNDILFIDNENFWDDVDRTSLDHYRVQMDAGGGVNSLEGYIDAVGHSWDTISHSGLGYTPSWNANPYDLEPLLENYFATLSMTYNTSIHVNPYVDGHSNVLEIYDNNPTGAISHRYYYDEIQIDSTIEFWWRYDGTQSYQHYLYFRVYEGGSERIRILFGYQQIGQIVSHNGTDYHSIVTGLPVNTFYHIKIVFDDSANTFVFYIDKVDKGIFDYFSNSVVGLDRIRISTRDTGDNYHHWLDAFGIVGVNGYEEGDNLEGWDKDYTIGENLYPDNIIMMNGSYDYTDNMKVNDDSYTTFDPFDDFSDYLYVSPDQWDNFTFTKGAGDTVGELETDNDANYCIVNSGWNWGAESFLGYIVPDTSDIIANWNEGDAAPHWSKLDEAKGDMDGDGGNIRESTDGVDDKWNFDTLVVPAESKISKVVVWFYMKIEDLAQGTLCKFTSSMAGVSGYEGSSLTYIWESDTTTGLSFSQTDLDDFWINVEPDTIIGDHGWIDIETVYVDIYVTPKIWNHDWYVTWDVDNPYSIDYFRYDYKTTEAIDTDLDIYNWDTTGWLELQSNTDTKWHTSSYTLTDPYISGTDQVRVRFQTATYSSTFNIEMDQIVLDYFTLTRDLEMIITFPLTNYGEDLLAMNIQSWQKTNISQTITFKIWNFNTETWVQISSSSETTFTKKEYNTTSPTNFISPSGIVKLNWTGLNITNDFQLHIDYLFVKIYYKLDLVHEKSFDTNGIYRYRWEITGSIHYTQWVVFEVVDPVPNFHAISESDNPTRWILQGADISPVENFTDDISGSNWDLDGVSIDFFQKIYSPTDDALVDENDPTTNYGSFDGLYLWSFDDHAVRHVFLKYPIIQYLTNNLTQNSRAYLYQFSEISDHNVTCWEIDSDFDEDVITWNNQPNLSDITSSFWANDTGWFYYEIDLIETRYHGLRIEPVISNNLISTYRSKEYGSNQPYLETWISKNFQGEGMMYMQTNNTETLSLKSTDYGSHYSLSSGDYFEVDFQTSSDSQINLILLKDGVVNKTLTLSQSGNTNFNRHTVQVSVDEDVEFDQLKISSTFEDTDNVKIYDIKTKKYTITGDSADFYVGSRRTEDVYLTPDTYNLRIFEEGDEKIDTNITISSDYYYVYTPIHTQYCRLVLFSIADPLRSLLFTDYHVKVNRSLDGEYNQFWLLDTIFYADDESYVYIDVYDRFDSLIGSFERLVSDYIDLEIEVYSLQIKNLQTQKTTIDINTTHVYPLLSEESIYFMLSKNYYQIGYYDTNDVYKQFLIYLNSNRAYELNRSKICFLAYVNQKGEHLYFDDYKTYVNDTLLYENVFYREIGDDIGIEVKDIYGISIKNQSYTVVSGDNYIPVVLTMYSLKVMNQQEQFNHINITRDPNYYESEYYWSEWIAPNEIVKFRLFPGYYKINLTNNEDGGYSFYEYTLNGDDFLLISSDNIISQVIYNIENVNTTIGNLITNVEINITNQNSQINNSIINIDINLGNINSTLGTMLVNLDVDITNIANNISNLYTFTENSFINLGNDINVSFISIENNIISINQSISNLVIGVSNDIYLINGTISTMITQLETNLLLMNVSIDTALFDLGTTLNLIGSNITSNFILLNNSIYLNNLNINDSRIAIINNLLLINNTISTLISDVYSAVYLINNSIYTAVVDLGTYLSLMNNTINGNLSIVLEMNEFLTEIYKMTMFSDLLNWTNIGLNTSLITTQIDVWTFINNYVNQSVEVHLRYQDLIEKLVISADDFRDQWLPNEDVEYNLWSVRDKKYVDEWTELDPKNKTVNFGFYEEEVPDFPSFDNTSITIILIILIFIGVIGFTTYFVYKYNKRVQNLKVVYARQHTIDKDIIEGSVRPRSSRMKKIK